MTCVKKHQAIVLPHSQTGRMTSPPSQKPLSSPSTSSGPCAPARFVGNIFNREHESSLHAQSANRQPPPDRSYGSSSPAVPEPVRSHKRKSAQALSSQPTARTPALNHAGSLDASEASQPKRPRVEPRAGGNRGRVRKQSSKSVTEADPGAAGVVDPYANTVR